MAPPIRIAFPLGIGDCHWSCMKLKAIRDRHPGREIHAYVNESPNHATVGYLEIVEHVDHAETSEDAPYGLPDSAMPPNYLHPKWTTLAGVTNWNGFDYLLVANGHVERGIAMKHFIPELETQYTYALRISDEDRDRSCELVPDVGGHPIVLYFSGRAPNTSFHGDWWSVGDWVHVLKLLNGEGFVPAVMGANTPDDRTYADEVRRASDDAGVEWIDVVGKTSIPQACALIQRAGVWCGLNSGLGIVSAMQGVPTVMMWGDVRYKCPGTHPGFTPAMQRCWLSGEQLKTYRTLSYGNPSTTPDTVVERILEVRR